MSLTQALIHHFILPVINLVVFVIFANVILSWLMAFNVVNAHNPIVRTIWRFTGSLTEPLLSPIRRVIPSLGGIDLSPLVLILIIFFVRDWVIIGMIMPRV